MTEFELEYVDARAGVAADEAMLLSTVPRLPVAVVVLAGDKKGRPEWLLFGRSTADSHAT